MDVLVDHAQEKSEHDMAHKERLKWTQFQLLENETPNDNHLNDKTNEALSDAKAFLNWCEGIVIKAANGQIINVPL